jgi:hypothetical protein
MDASLREFVRVRAGHRCEYCRLSQEYSDLRFHVDHITPRSHGGATDQNNLALACPSCNLKKGTNLTGIDPDNGSVVALFNPRLDHWFDHFAYHGDRLLGITSTGRTTVTTLAMNDAERRRIRQLEAIIHG